jgi:hypothetical protein
VVFHGHSAGHFVADSVMCAVPAPYGRTIPVAAPLLLPSPTGPCEVRLLRAVALRMP